MGYFFMIFGWLFLQGGCSSSEERPPNILFILTDDQGSWTLGAGDYPNTYTPEMDRLAEQGMYFKNMFAVSAVCSPSRAALMTGRYPSETGILTWIPVGSDEGVDTSLVMWPELLQEAGYHTFMVGKWHMGSASPAFMPTRRGYDHFSGFPHGGMKSMEPEVLVEGEWRTYKDRYTPDVLTELAMDYIRQSRDEPFVLSLNYWAPHANTEFPEGFSPPYDDRSWLPLKDIDLEPWEDMDLKIPNPGFPNLDTQRVKRMMREYYASVHSVDRNIGRLMDLLDSLGLSDNTVVIFTSDHGYMMGHHGLWHKGNGRWITNDKKDPEGIYGDERRNMFDLSLVVPCIVRWPGHTPPGSVTEETVTFLDWFPTILDIAGVEKPEGIVLRGKSVRPLLEGMVQEKGDTVYAEYETLRMIRTDRWKYVSHLSDRSLDELYHLTEDPGEYRNLIGTGIIGIREKAHEMKETIYRKMRTLDDGDIDKWVPDQSGELSRK